MVARDIQREFDQEPEVAVIMPLLVGTDGTQKMSKSLGNYVGVTDAPEEIYGKLMSVSDELMFDYLEILRLESAGEVKQIRADVAAGKAHPKEVKMAMARRVVELYHDAGAARAAEEHFERVHREGQAPEDMPTHTPSANPIVLATLLVEAGLAPSKSEARRLVSQNAVSINDEKVADPQAEVTFVGGEVIKVGKRRFAQIKL
jgi:tyrosyl-tRNA synthetase